MIARAATATEQQSHRQRFALAFFLLLVFGLMASMCLKLNAQNAAAPPANRPAGNGAAGKIAVIPMHESFKKEATVRRMERAAGSFVTHQGDPAAFGELRYAEAYFRMYLPAKITQPDAYEDVSRLTQEALAYLTRAQRSNTPGSRKILEWIYVGMKQVAEGNHVDIARINATLALGRLDQRPAGQAQEPPVPLRFSLPILINLYSNDKNSDGVRAAALQGIRRYTMYGFPYLTDADRTSIKKLCSDLLDAPAPSGRNAKAHAFLQKYAVDIMDNVRTGNDPQLAKQLVSITSDLDRPNLIALHSAAKISRMSEPLKGQVADPQTVLSSWSVRTWQAFKDELKHLESLDGAKPAASQPPTPESQIALREQARASTRARGRGMDEYEDEDEGYMGGMDSYGDDYGMGEMDRYGEDEDEYSEMEGYGDMDMYGGYGRAAVAVNPQPPEVVASRKRLNHLLQQLHLGASNSTVPGEAGTGGLFGSVEADDQAAVVEWLTEMQVVVEGLNDRANDTKLKFVTALTDQIEVLRTIAGPAAAAIEEAERDAMIGIVSSAPTDLGDVSETMVGIDEISLPGVTPDAAAPAAPEVIPAQPAVTVPAQPPTEQPSAANGGGAAANGGGDGTVLPPE